MREPGRFSIDSVDTKGLLVKIGGVYWAETLKAWRGRAEQRSEVGGKREKEQRIF